jgi:hypothetical protein
MTESASGPERAFVVEISLDLGEQGERQTSAYWDQLLARLSESTYAAALLQAMPAIEHRAQGQVERLRWVGIQAVDSEAAIMQARGFLGNLAALLPGLDVVVTDACAYEEGSSPSQ